MRRSTILPALVLSLALPAFAQIDPDLLAGISARSIGPAAMSGRVADVAVVESDTDVVYAGAATGGVWKSTNGGLTWSPVFDDQPVASIGAVAVFQPNPDVVWVGSGEGNPRNSVSAGNGIYKSLDGGRTWKHLGLEKTERIHRVLLHPADPDVAYVAAQGKLWGENPERGVFKTTDGGRTWKRVLYVDERTGAAELVMDPANPNKLFAAMWDHRRQPWRFRSGGPGSGLYVTHDGGESWKRLTEDDGLPRGELGRMGIAISRSNPNVVYALVEAQKSALIRSDDGGRTWKAVNEDQRTANRPFYYADIRVDPTSPDRVYNIATRLSVSTDGGKTFNVMPGSRTIHGDYHALWIDPEDPEHLIVGNDGGLGISHDRGETFRFVANLPLAQYYHVNVDMETPYNVYGGLQDNGSWRGPSSVWEERGNIRNHQWQRIGGGDGFDVLPDPEDATRGYSMSQGGDLTRWDLRLGEMRGIKPPEIDPENDRLRFNWNADIAQDPFEPGTIYYGSQYVHKSTDRGETWTVISPDLTTDTPEWQRRDTGGLTPDVTGAENHTTILAISPSPKQKGVLWVGTDDGRVHVTRDGGKTWESVEKNLRGVPANTWVPHIRASKFDAASAFIVLDNHRRDDSKPYVFRTDDWGKTWKSLATNDLQGYALAIDQDPVDRDLLFLGTESGLYVSNDGGRSWMKWRHGLPETVSAMDLVIHPRDHDLVVATHGRAVYILDDIAPLRELTAETMREPLHLYPSSPAWLHRFGGGSGNPRSGAGEFAAESRPYGALLTWSLNAPGLPHPDEDKERERREKERAEARQAAAQPSDEEAEAGKPSQETKPEPEEKPKDPKVKIEIADASGKIVRTLEAPAKQGLNRTAWDLGRDAWRRPPTDNRGNPQEQRSGPEVPPGTYNVTVRYKDHEAKGTVKVVAAPVIANTEADWQAREDAL
ncbi:MAG: VPS10 domain-containing protein, partial [Thermoanaerobaculia bacterium]